MGIHGHGGWMWGRVWRDAIGQGVHELRIGRHVKEGICSGIVALELHSCIVCNRALCCCNAGLLAPMTAGGTRFAPLTLRGVFSAAGNGIEDSDIELLSEAR